MVQTGHKFRRIKKTCIYHSCPAGQQPSAMKQWHHRSDKGEKEQRHNGNVL